MENGGTIFSDFKERIAGKLDQAADTLRGQTESSGTLGPYSQQASEWLHQSAHYIRSFDVGQADADLRNRIRTHPGKSIMIGLAAGIVAGFVFRRR